MKRRITCVISLVIALYGAAGYLLVLQVSRDLIHNEIREAIARNDIDEKVADFSFSKSYWKSIQAGCDEFMLDGKIYDIVSYKETDDGVVVSAVCDEEENKLLRLLSWAQQPSNNRGSLPEALLYFLNSLMVYDDSGIHMFFIVWQFINSSLIFPVSSSYNLVIYSPPDFMKG